MKKTYILFTVTALAIVATACGKKPEADAAPAAAAAISGETIYNEKGCVTCHGAARPVKDSGIPSLAGRPANEIELKMRAYAAGNTPGDLMQQIAKGYDAATIGRIARWYAQLKPEVQ